MSAAPLRWGLLSTAKINDALLGAVGDERFVAVASRSADRAADYAREKGIARSHGSYEALLADPEVDAVYVPLPNGLHVDWSIAALRAGKHVLCEKPMSRSPGEVERAFDVAEEQGLVLAEAFMWRHHPQAHKARDLIASGAIGRLRTVRAAFSFLLTNEQDVRLQRELDGGALMDVGCYCVSGCRALTGGEPVRVHGTQVTGGDGVDVAFAAVLHFGDDVLATIDCSFTSAPHHHLEAVGDEGSLRLEDPWHGRTPGITVSCPGQEPEWVEIDAANPYELELDDFEAAVRGERAPLLGRDDAVGQARAIAALYASADQRED